MKAPSGDKTTPLLAVDLTIRRSNVSIVLVKRKNPPFKNHYAIPTGFVECGETVEGSAFREAQEETGLEVQLLSLLGIYSEPERDPRGHVVSIVYLAEEAGGMLKADSDAREVKAFKKIPKRMAFDHRRILTDLLDKLRSNVRAEGTKPLKY
jgi:8-oxo-dGTP diphosphatase